MSDNSNKQTSGVSFAGLLTLIFITLKLTGYITWSWWWVLAPLWISGAIIVAVFLFALAIFLAQD